MGSSLAREIILAIGDNMRAGLEPLLTRTLAPSLYQVYLHADDYERLRPVFSEIEAEARAYLDRELGELSRRASASQRRLSKVPRPLRERLGSALRATDPTHVVSASGDWHIRFQSDPNERLAPGEIEVVSELAVADQGSYGAGSPTRRIGVNNTRRLAERRAEGGSDPSRPAVATLSYVDDEGEHNAPLERDEVVIGRGAVDVWVDVRVTSRHDVSRRHAALRRDPITGAYFLKDLSSFGTSVGGRRLREGEEVELRDGDRIELAGILAMVFHAPRSNAGAHASGAAAR